MFVNIHLKLDNYAFTVTHRATDNRHFGHSHAAPLALSPSLSVPLAMRFYFRNDNDKFVLPRKSLQTCDLVSACENCVHRELSGQIAQRTSIKINCRQFYHLLSRSGYAERQQRYVGQTEYE